MTNRLYDEVAERTRRAGNIIAKQMPHLVFARWDLSEFMHTFHNVRRNMIFIECEKVAHGEVRRILAANTEFRDCIVYSGERKPKAVNEEWASAKGTVEISDVIVIIARSDFTETRSIEGNICIPSRERRLVDLMAYALRGYLPIAVEEATAAWIWFLKREQLRITALQRYATRRYLGWFLDILLYKLAEKRGTSATIDSRYLDNGRRYFEAIQKVDEVEQGI